MFRKIIYILLISLFFILPIYNVQAGYWSENYSANAIKQLLEEISEQIKVAVNSAAKMASIEQATSVMESLLYGDGASQRNITNFTDFLIKEPMNEAITYGEDFLTTSLRGTTSGDYTSSGSGFLSKSIESAGKEALQTWKGSEQETVDYQEHCGEDWFSEGSYECFTAVMSNPLNTPIGMALATDAVMASSYAANQLTAELTATSSGVLPGMDANGNIRLPSSIVEAIQSSRITLPLQALVNGDSGVFSSAVKAMAVTMVTSAFNAGMSQVEEAVNKNVDAFNAQYNQEMSEIYSQVGPALEYANDAYTIGQQIQSEEASVWDNPDTPEDESQQNSTSTSTPNDDNDVLSTDANGSILRDSDVDVVADTRVAGSHPYENMPTYTQGATRSEDTFTNPTTGEVVTGARASNAAIDWSITDEGMEYVHNNN